MLGLNCDFFDSCDFVIRTIYKS